ncbi:hypothetical protein GGTG_02296 [Gaeumannomyces tritici R3-111a-1]|uniref:Uncharacterized protein n=1 Tax=Gaeumannomyces tritici (strain R3-111a-1) TaxID=644352 RepID=J3NLZ1_GAET3|nr:hypothetical protein GGTG_02296 [Gaeumannomyces tritici R3-111a-1]EJT82322.1 hypothetical protein GGTG_02296 [Gaeumannomyces tritici R3-111a-1]
MDSGNDARGVPVNLPLTAQESARDSNSDARGVPVNLPPTTQDSAVDLNSNARSAPISLSPAALESAVYSNSDARGVPVIFSSTVEAGEDIMHVVGRLAGHVPFGHNPTPDLVTGLLGYDRRGDIDDASLAFVFARSEATKEIVGALVLWRLTTFVTIRPRSLPISKVCFKAGRSLNSPELRFWRKANGMLRKLMREGVVDMATGPAYVLFQAVDPGCCSTMEQLKDIYDRMYEQAGERHGFESLVMGSPCRDGFGFLQEPLKFRVLYEEIVLDDERDCDIYLWWREP